MFKNKIVDFVMIKNYWESYQKKKEVKKEIKKIIDCIDISKINIIRRNNCVRQELLEKAMKNYIKNLSGPKIYIDKKYSSFQITSKEEYENLPEDHELKKNFPFLFYPFVGEMGFSWWIYNDEEGGFITKIVNQSCRYDVFRFFSSEEDFEAVVRVAFEGIKADLKDLRFIERIICYYEKIFKKDRLELIEEIK
jgi:hypothetical protein